MRPMGEASNGSLWAVMAATAVQRLATAATACNGLGVGLRGCRYLLQRLLQRLCNGSCNGLDFILHRFLLDNIEPATAQRLKQKSIFTVGVFRSTDFYVRAVALLQAAALRTQIPKADPTEVDPTDAGCCRPVSGTCCEAGSVGWRSE